MVSEPTTFEQAVENPRALVLDDDSVIRRLLGRLLEPEGFEVLEVSTARAARDALTGVRFDLVLLDHDLPDGDGLSVCRAIRESELLNGMANGRRVPVIMLSGRAGGDDFARDADSAGVDLVLGKPFENHAVMAAARRLVADSAGRRR